MEYTDGNMKIERKDLEHGNYFEFGTNIPGCKTYAVILLEFNNISKFSFPTKDCIPIFVKFDKRQHIDCVAEKIQNAINIEMEWMGFK